MSVATAMSDLRDRIAGLTPEKRALLEKRLMAKKAPPAGSDAPIPRRQPGDPCPLSCCQQRLWFLDQLSPNTSTYNVPNALRLRGPLDVGAFRKTLEAIVARHEILRTNFAIVDGTPVQIIKESWSLNVPVTDLRHLRGVEQARDLSRLLDKAVR